MDDLEAVWGPNGRATVDPASVRVVAGSEPEPEPARPAPAAPRPDRHDGEILPADTGQRASRTPAVAVAAVFFAAAASLLAVAAFAGRGSGGEPATAVATGRASSATTIVSAAADLLGRATTTTTIVGSVEATPTGPPGTAPSDRPTTATSVTTTGQAGPGTAGPALAAAEAEARRFVDALAARDCEGLWSRLSARTRELLEGAGKEGFCASLDDGTIPAIRVHGPARPTERGAAVPFEAEGDVEDLHLVVEDGAWRVDLLGAMADPEDEVEGEDDPEAASR